ncbi:MAG: PHP domain-containing protein [Lachnospiraceae bacterium]|nr:PHP domain-containing protein [Lachnospiraceae bacterium]
MIDLHVHSNKSDGSLSPTQLVELAAEKKLSAFALTDHDTTDGLDEAMEAAARYNASLAHDAGNKSPLEVIPGIEFSTEYQGKDVHILGLFIDYQSPVFKEKIQAFVDSRILRNEKMCKSLSTEGIDITYEKLLAEYPCAVITRSHYARYLHEHGYVSSVREAFDRYIGDHAKHYIPREKITPVQAIELIKEVHGLAVLAHPVLYRMSDANLETLVALLKENGLDGIEAIYSTYTAGEERQIRALAKKYDLLITGGSDFHGAVKPGLEMATGYGKLAVPEDILVKLKEALKAG